MTLTTLVTNIVPLFLKENFQLVAFFGSLTYVLFLVHWIISTDWEAKFNWFSLIIGITGFQYLHYSHVILLAEYEPLFVTIWVLLLCYHLSIWNTNYSKINQALKSTTMIASLKPYDGSILKYFIILPTMKTSAGQWNTPPFRNAVHVLLVALYSSLLLFHIQAYVTPFNCRNDASPNCCRYNFVMQNFDTLSLNMNYCSGPVRVGFAGSWSTGKTTIISALLGHNYSTAQIAPAPTTDKFICIALGAPYSDPIRSDDYETRKNCDLMSHLGDVTQKICGKSQPNVLDVADKNTEFRDFVFFDMPGWQNEYADDCTYSSFYSQLIEKMDFVYVVWDLNHGKIDDKFASFFKEKAHGTEYELIYNRYEENTANMAFLNQQYGKMRKGQEILSEGYVLKVHENRTDTDTDTATATAQQYKEDIRMLRSKILSVNQTVHDGRKISMKDMLTRHRSKISGLDSLRKLKIADRLIKQDLNIHSQPKHSILRHLNIEL